MRRVPLRLSQFDEEGEMYLRARNHSLLNYQVDTGIDSSQFT
jgi:hypothetical protein